MLTPRQRVLETVAHRQADRIPVDFWAESSVLADLRRQLALNDDEAVLKAFGVDLRYFNGPRLMAQRVPAYRKSGPSEVEGLSYDHWGVARKVQTASGLRRDGSSFTWSYKHLHASPLANARTIEEIDAYDWPRADMWDYSDVQAACEALKEAGHAVVAGADRLDRTAQLKPAMYLRGAEQFMEDLVLAPELAECVLEHISDYYLQYNQRFFEAAAGSIDIFFMGDDMGTQQSTWVSPAMYRRFFKKRLAAYCELAHRYGMRTMYHTCGYVLPLVEDFIQAGLDILQSLQPQAMGEQLATLKREYGRDLCFQGGIDIQDVLPHGSPADVEAHVRHTAKLLGEGGGYIFGTAHNLLPDTPLENILALVEAYQKYGRYS